MLDEGTEPWGVMVERVEVKDVRVPEQLQRAMAAEAEAAREARAKVIAAEGEHKASRALRQAAEVIMDSPAALQVNNRKSLWLFDSQPLQLRYLQTLNSISAENNSTIVFPVPIDIMSNFMQFSQNNHQHTSEQYQQYQNYLQQYQPQPSDEVPIPPPPSTKPKPPQGMKVRSYFNNLQLMSSLFAANFNNSRLTQESAERIE